MAFVYKRRSFKDAQKIASEAGSGNDFYPMLKRKDGEKLKWFKPKAGENCIRILPATWDGGNDWFLSLQIHGNVGRGGAGGKYGERMLCAEEGCPLCEESYRRVEAADGMGDKEVREAGEMAVRTMRLIYILDRDDPESGAMLFAIPLGIFEDVATISVDTRNSRVLYVDDPDEGFDILFTRKGVGLSTKYSGVRLDSMATALDNDAALQQAIENPLPSLVTLYPPETMLKVMGKQKAATSDVTDTERALDKRRGRESNEVEDDLPNGAGVTSAGEKPADDKPPLDFMGMDYMQLSAYATEHDIDISVFADHELDDIRDWLNFKS